ncbi:hypothetical protein, partial [Sinorhizobium meliloti]|uniref:hypothetical protein n=1 Tax=Rhizobium meliloti TaxID=382 RepID=UPI001F2B7338
RLHGGPFRFVFQAKTSQKLSILRPVEIRVPPRPRIPAVCSKGMGQAGRDDPAAACKEAA